MQHAIELLRIALDTARNNEAIQRTEGRIHEADSNASNAYEIAEALDVLESRLMSMSNEDCESIAEILKEQANEIASVVESTRNTTPVKSVDRALRREITRLRELADSLLPLPTIDRSVENFINNKLFCNP